VAQVLRFSGVALSHAGLVRPDNEDSGFLGPSCMLVADGVGGAPAGEVASATAAYVLSALATSDRTAAPDRMLRTGLRLAQEQLALGVRRDAARAGMATTLTGVATDGERFALAHVGDSRGYVFREGRLTRITRDHTFVQRLVDEGSATEDEAGRHPWRNVVLRSLNAVETDTGDVTALGLVEGDRVVLASDGLTDLVSELRIESVLAAHHDDAAAERLLDAALSAGGKDNVTCLLATVVQGTQAVADVLVGAARDLRNVVDPAAVRMRHSA
jgi:protein phosphatase